MLLLDQEEEYCTDNLPREERRALIGLKKRINDGEIRIPTSDKGGEFIRQFHFALFSYISHRIPENL